MASEPAIEFSDMAISDLEHDGFSVEQIELLEWLSTIYPYAEYIGRGMELYRLLLLRWLYEQGRIEP
jgi:hypothetical protein